MKADVIAFVAGVIATFEEEALATAPHPPNLWKRYVDDTFVIQEEKYKNEFFQHINSLEDNIKFTAETTKAHGSMPFLDTLVTPRSDGSLETKIYRKPTHTNQYLQWDSHHAINNKYSIISTLLHRARNICSNKELLEEEQANIQKALSACKYPYWAINRMKLKVDAPKTRQNRNNKTTCRSHITVPYDEGLSEIIKNIAKIWHTSSFQKWQDLKR